MIHRDPLTSDQLDWLGEVLLNRIDEDAVTEGLDEGVIGIFDVYDKQGRFTRQVTLKGDGDPLNDGYFFVRDRLFVVTDFLPAMMALQGGGGGEQEEEAEEEPELMQIISYRVN